MAPREDFISEQIDSHFSRDDSSSSLRNEASNNSDTTAHCDTAS